MNNSLSSLISLRAFRPIRLKSRCLHRKFSKLVFPSSRLSFARPALAGPPSSAPSAGLSSLSGMDVLDSPSSPELGRVYVSGLSLSSFVVGGVKLAGPVLLLPSRALQWRVGGDAREGEGEDLWQAEKEGEKRREGGVRVSVASLRALSLLHPAPELLLLGTGKHASRVPAEVARFFRSRGTAVEAADSFCACSTFNTLAGEGRLVVAALLTLDQHLAVD